jgi:hypothetical protein
MCILQSIVPTSYYHLHHTTDRYWFPVLGNEPSTFDSNILTRAQSEDHRNTDAITTESIGGSRLKHWADSGGLDALGGGGAVEFGVLFFFL